MKQFVTYGLFVDLHDMGYERRYCYETLEEAVAGLNGWGDTLHPPGPWIKCKGRLGGQYVDMLNPELFKEHG